MRRATGEHAAADGPRRRRQREEFDLGQVSVGKNDRAVKSEVALAHSRKCATAKLATAFSSIRATAIPFSFSPFSFIFLHILFFSFHLFLFLSFSFTFLFVFHFILFPLAVALLQGNALLLMP